MLEDQLQLPDLVSERLPRRPGVDIEAAAKAVALIGRPGRADPPSRGRRRGRRVRGALPDRRRAPAGRGHRRRGHEARDRARAVGRLDTVGIDLVAMCADDVVCTGAEPLFFLDYLAVGRVVPERVAAIVEGVAEGCRRAGCALLGGETAEHPGVMPDDQFDLAGFCVGRGGRGRPPRARRGCARATCCRARLERAPRERLLAGAHARCSVATTWTRRPASSSARSPTSCWSRARSTPSRCSRSRGTGSCTRPPTSPAGASTRTSRVRCPPGLGAEIERGTWPEHADLRSAAVADRAPRTRTCSPRSTWGSAWCSSSTRPMPTRSIERSDHAAFRIGRCRRRRRRPARLRRRGLSGAPPRMTRPASPVPRTFGGRSVHAVPRKTARATDAGHPRSAVTSYSDDRIDRHRDQRARRRRRAPGRLGAAVQPGGRGLHDVRGEERPGGARARSPSTTRR